MAAKDSRLRPSFSPELFACSSASSSFTSDCTAEICLVALIRRRVRSGDSNPGPCSGQSYHPHLSDATNLIRRVEREFRAQGHPAVSFPLGLRGRVPWKWRPRLLGAGALPLWGKLMSPKIGLALMAVVIAAGLGLSDHQQARAGEVGDASGYRVLEPIRHGNLTVFPVAA